MSKHELIKSETKGLNFTVTVKVDTNDENITYEHIKPIP